MSIVEELMQTATSDTDLLRTLDGQGDDFSVPRDVDFLMRAPSQERAELVANFINDNQYGVATAEESGGKHSVNIVIRMPVQQHLALSVSGFMACVATLFGLDYDGWGCIAQKSAQHIVAE
ncbi:ribonuclease E inhibitor RraB [Dyella humicola]|uniref:ribonuclease E inhibitor RraB n=1 Tax=Dyella humicola TaxID=2992126 RepID=UPI00225C0E12|nr:ribonuclease E inhibitor RraB [Dyella humicola]